tara:strand:- start:310 stop:549 length:240 start_codon:yes stop_codon:yes gene_type:complete
MNSFFYFPLMGTALFALINNIGPSTNFSDSKELNEVCDVDYSRLSAIALCKIDDPDMSFEEKVRVCTLKMRVTSPPPKL